MIVHDLRHRLEGEIASYGSVIVGFSAGVDSTVVAAAAHEALGENALIVTAVTETITEEDLELGRALARERGWDYLEVAYNELDLPNYAENPTDRCFWCKDGLYSHLRRLADERRIAIVADGANVDDIDDYRPGRKAATEWGVRSPLLDLGITKVQVREIARTYDLPNHDKPSAPCLSSRVPYGTAITREILQQINRAERALRELGFRELRVRHHDDVARIELPVADLQHAVELASIIDERLRTVGYRYVSLDLGGFRSGSLNSAIVEIELPVTSA